jgi:hypothetical protein
MQKVFLFLILMVTATVILTARPPKLPKPKKDAEWVEPAKPKNIFSSWTWIETNCCGLRQGISTPESTADNIDLDLKQDNTFMETHTKVNALPRSGNFNLFKENLNDMIQFNDERPAQYFLSSNGDTLTISWKYLELQVEKYVRKK